MLFLIVGFGGLRDEQREAQLAQIAAFVPLDLLIFRLLVMESVAWSPLRHLASTMSSERVRHFKLNCVAGLCSKLVFRNSGHIQQFRVEAISLRAGRVSLCGPRQPTLSFIDLSIRVPGHTRPGQLSSWSPARRVCP